MTNRDHSAFEIRQARASDIASIVAITNAAFAVETFLEGTRTDQPGISGMALKPRQKSQR
jgi:hypothetical protein